MDKVLPKIVKRGTDQGKAFAQAVLDNATAVSKQKSLDSRASKASDIKVSTGTSLDDKKPSSGGVVGSQVPKKSPTATTTASLDSVQAGGKSGTPLAKKLSAADPKASNKGAVPTSTGPKVKTNVVTPKATSFFSNLQSASKKPGTSNAALKAARLKDGKDGYVLNGLAIKFNVYIFLQPCRSASESKSLSGATAGPKPFSFADTLKNLNKTKESEPVESEEDRAPETPEERRKRLRKEDRRKLRVSFKPDDSLVQIRVFEHHPDEEIGHDDSMVRDANDIKGEGQMLKMHRERDVPDEDEEIGDIPVPAAEEVLRPWRLPRRKCLICQCIQHQCRLHLVVVDFNDIPPAEQERNYSARGGKISAESEDKALQEDRETKTLIVTYTALSDIPPSPREPIDQDPDDFNPEQSFGAPAEETKVRFLTTKPLKRLPTSLM